MELNFESIGIQKWNKSMDRTQKLDEKTGFLSCYHVYSRSYVHYIITNGLFWVKDLSKSERPHFALLKNVIDYRVLSNH